MRTLRHQTLQLAAAGVVGLANIAVAKAAPPTESGDAEPKQGSAQSPAQGQPPKQGPAKASPPEVPNSPEAPAQAQEPPSSSSTPTTEASEAAQPHRTSDDVDEEITAESDAQDEGGDTQEAEPTEEEEEEEEKAEDEEEDAPAPSSDPDATLAEQKKVSVEEANAGVLPENFIDTRAGAIEVTESDGNLPTAGYERTPANGAFVQSPDGELRVQAGAFGVLRWTGNWRDPPPVDTDEPEPIDNANFTQGFTLRQVQIFLEGKYGPVAFHLRPRIAGDSGFQLQVFWAEVQLAKRWSLRFGKHFIPLSREDWTNPHDILTTEYSPHNFAYAFGTSYGGFVRYTGERHRVWLSLHTNAADGTNEEFPAVTNDVSGAARWEWRLVGDNWGAFSDQVGRPGRSTSVMLGSSAAVLGTVGDPTQGNDLAAQGNLDLTVDADSIHAFVAGSWTWLDPVDGAPEYTWGLVGQIGGFVHDHIQLYTQYNLLAPGTVDEDLIMWHSAAAGMTYFPFRWTNRHRVGIEGGALFSEADRTILGSSVNLGFLASEGTQGYLRLQVTTGF